MPQSYYIRITEVKELISRVCPRQLQGLSPSAYPDSDSVRLDTPTVRALVKRCKVVKPATGMILFLH